MAAWTYTSSTCVFFANVHWTIPEVISARTFLVQTCYHQILLCLDKPILQYTCQTFFWRTNILQQFAHKIFHMQRWGFCITGNFEIQEVQLVPGILNFILAVRSFSAPNCSCVAGWCSCLHFVQTQQLSCYPSTSWWVCRSLFAKRIKSYGTWHFNAQMTQKRTSTFI